MDRALAVDATAEQSRDHTGVSQRHHSLTACTPIAAASLESYCHAAAITATISADVAVALIAAGSQPCAATTNCNLSPAQDFKCQ